MTGPLRKQPGWTRDDFLAWADTQDERYEFVGGVVKMMVGGTLNHSTIALNVASFLKRSLRGTPCRVFQETARLLPSDAENAMFPDVLVTCRPVEGRSLGLTSATVLVEVLSKSSSQDDHGRKWEAYQRIPELRHYLIVDQSAPIVNVYSRAEGEAQWTFVRLEGMGRAVDLNAIDVQLPLAAIYEDVTF